MYNPFKQLVFLYGVCFLQAFLTTMREAGTKEMEKEANQIELVEA